MPTGPWAIDLAPKAAETAPLTDRSLWRNRDFRFFGGASAVAQSGYGIFAVAFPWLARLLIRDPLLIGMVGMARSRLADDRAPACAAGGAADLVGHGYLPGTV